LIILCGSIPIFYPEVLYSERIEIPYYFLILILVDYPFLTGTLAAIDSKVIAILDFIAFLTFFLGSPFSGSDSFTALFDLIVYPILSVALVAGDRALQHRQHRTVLAEFPSEAEPEASATKRRKKRKKREMKASIRWIESEIEKIRDFMKELES